MRDWIDLFEGSSEDEADRRAAAEYNRDRIITQKVLRHCEEIGIAGDLRHSRPVMYDDSDRSIRIYFESSLSFSDLKRLAQLGDQMVVHPDGGSFGLVVELIAAPHLEPNVVPLFGPRSTK